MRSHYGLNDYLKYCTLALWIKLVDCTRVFYSRSSASLGRPVRCPDAATYSDRHCVALAPPGSPPPLLCPARLHRLGSPAAAASSRGPEPPRRPELAAPSRPAAPGSMPPDLDALPDPAAPGSPPARSCRPQPRRRHWIPPSDPDALWPDPTSDSAKKLCKAEWAAAEVLAITSSPRAIFAAASDEAASLRARLAEAEGIALQVRVERLECEAVECDELLFVLLAATHLADANLYGSEHPDGREVGPFPSSAFAAVSVSVLGPPLPPLPRAHVQRLFGLCSSGFCFSAVLLASSISLV